ncbi:MAG: hypothetical protein GY939_04470 [Actinomycetia bacterium]|nr:hypothetical protein [Actinomycetes bacterium]
MPERPLSPDEIVGVLDACVLVRVAFVADPAPYVVTFGYVHLDGHLVGTMGPGHKLELAQDSPMVGFQLDTSTNGHIYEWRSVHGVGRFSCKAVDPVATAAIRQRFPNPPAWFIEDRMADLSAGTSLTWRIDPTQLHGRRDGP